ncbi:MAG: DALR domain-containing protein, partial [Candidatus Omnitrophota bacterium]
DEAKKARERFYILFEKIDHAQSDKMLDTAEVSRELESLKAKFEEAMDDDFNTSLAMGYLYEMVSFTNKAIDKGALGPKGSQQIKNIITELGGVFGLFKDEKEFKKSSNIDTEIMEKIKSREEARKRGDYAAADKIRQELSSNGIILEDTKSGTQWRKID